MKNQKKEKLKIFKIKRNKKRIKDLKNKSEFISNHKKNLMILTKKSPLSKKAKEIKNSLVFLLKL